MKYKVMIFMFVLIFASTSLLSADDKADASDRKNTAQEKIDAIQAGLDSYEELGDIRHPLVKQLDNRLRQTQHHLDKGDAQQAIKMMESFLHHLHNNGMQQYVTATTKEQLNAEANQLIAVLDGQVVPGELTIVSNGQAQAVILLPEDARSELRIAANTLAEYVYKSTGAELPVLTAQEGESYGQDYEGHVKIHVGNEQDPHLESGLQDLHDAGFMIHPHEDELYIVGPTIWGTINGVHEFLERYAGVRWLLPGENGEDVPQLTDLYVPREDVRDEPAFTYREISPAYGSPYDENEHQLLAIWAQRNKMQGGYNRPIEFMHNLAALVPPEKYGETNPEFYPNGIPPEPGATHRWQPCFTVEGTVDAAVDSILEYFGNNPDKMSISLGVNDIGGYCEENPNHPDYPGETNSVGLVNMSDIYYAWVNEVVEQVLEVYPDKWFGLLAYREVVEPPSFPVHSRVVPFLTKDRMSWLDDGTRQEGQTQIEDWNVVASQLGLYDYMYGTLYAIPRINFRVMADNFSFAEEEGVFGHYTEMAPNIGDGPKFWLAGKLQWNPDQDVDVLLAEWYERAVGKEAAADLEAYFELWEDFWTNRITDTAWFTRGINATYLQFTDTSYLQFVTDEDLLESKQLMDAVVEKAGPGKQKERALRFQKMFEYYEASVLSYARPSEMPEDESSALAMYERMSNSKQLAQKRHELMDEFEADDLLRMRSRPWVDWTGEDGFAFWNLADYLSQYETEGGGLTTVLQEAAEDHDDPEHREVAKMLQQANLGQFFTLPENHSFEKGSGNSPPWYLYSDYADGTVQRVEGVARTGNASLLMDNLRRGGMAQSIDITPGMVAARVHYYVPAGSETNGSIRINMNLKNAAGANIPSASVSGDRQNLSNSNGEWVEVVLLGEIPEEFEGIEVKKATIGVVVENAQNLQVYVDDVEVIQADMNMDITSRNFWELSDYLQQNDTNNAVYRYVIQLAQGTGEQAEYASLLLQTLEEPSLTVNSSFETGDDDAPPWYLSPAASVTRVEGIARTGQASVLINRSSSGLAAQAIDIQPGLFAARVYYYIPEGTSTNGTIHLNVNLKDAAGSNIPSGRITSDSFRLADANGQWAEASLVAEIPSEFNGIPVEQLSLVVGPQNAGNIQVYIDDFVAYQ